MVASVKAATKCDAIEVKEAATRLGIDEKQHSRLGAELRYTWELTRDLEESRVSDGEGREPTTMFGVGVGDYLRRRRGR